MGQHLGPPRATHSAQVLMPSHEKAGDPQDLELWAMAPQLAWHFEAAGMVDKALGYLVQAARRADWLLGLAEMNTYITRTMRMLPALPDPFRRAAYEFYHREPPGRDDGIRRWLIAPEAGQAWGRAYDLAEYMEHIPTRWYALKRLADYHRQGGALRLARQYGQRAIDLSHDQVPLLLTVAQANQAQTLLLSGDWAGQRILRTAVCPVLAATVTCPGFVFQDHCNFLARPVGAMVPGISGACSPREPGAPGRGQAPNSL